MHVNQSRSLENNLNRKMAVSLARKDSTIRDMIRTGSHLIPGRLIEKSEFNILAESAEIQRSALIKRKSAMHAAL